MNQVMAQRVAVCLIFGVAIGGSTGLLLGALAFVVLQFIVPAIDDRIQCKQGVIPLHEVELFVEILWLGTQSGLSAQATLQTQQHLLSPQFQSEVRKLLNRSDVGMSWHDSLAVMGNALPQLRFVMVILQQSSSSGAPITLSLEKTLHIVRKKSSAEQLRRIKSVGVKAVLPLGACFLPAFVLLTIVPIVANLIPQIVISNH